MESETPAEAKIFFKDKQNELKGPYTEREVQDWYRQNWFDSSFHFYFMKGDERPTEHTEFITLETLRTLNGVGCPFAHIKWESNDEKISKLAKESDDLSKKCDGVKNLEKRLEDVEKRLKELATQPLEDVEKRLNLEKLSTQPPPTSSSSDAAAAPVAALVATKAAAAQAATVAKKPEKQPEEDSEHAKLANAWAAYYLDVLEAYKTNKWEIAGEDRLKQLLDRFMAAEDSEDLRMLCRDVLLKKLMQLDYVYCSECDAIFHNFKQILLHAAEQKHLSSRDALHERQRSVNHVMQCIFTSLLENLVQANQDATDIGIFNYPSVNISSTHLRPLLSFVDHLTQAYGDAIFDYAGNVDSNRWQIVAKMMPRFKQNVTMGRKMMSELHEHIGDKMTRCYDCKQVTGTREEYYKHLRTHLHLRTTNAMDLITLIVNMFNKK